MFVPGVRWLGLPATVVDFASLGSFLSLHSCLHLDLVLTVPALVHPWDREARRCSAKPRLGHRWLRHRGELLLGDRLHTAGVVVVSAVLFKAWLLLVCAGIFKNGVVAVSARLGTT